MFRTSGPSRGRFFICVVAAGTLLLAVVLFFPPAWSEQGKVVIGDGSKPAALAEAGLGQANADLRKRIELAAGILRGLDQRAKLVKQTVPQAGVILDNFSGLLSTKPPKHDGIAGGLFWRLSAVHWQLGQAGKKPGKSPSKTSTGGLSLDSSLAGQVQAVKTIALTGKIHDDILKLKKSADDGLGKAAKTLWGRNEKSSSIVLEAFRKESTAGLNQAAKLLEDGLKAYGVAQRKYFLGLASSSALGADAKQVASGRAVEGKGSGPDAAVKFGEVSKTGSAASPFSAVVPSSAGRESLLDRGRARALAVASAVGGLAASGQQTCPPGFDRKFVEGMLANVENTIRSSQERLAILERSLANWKSSSCGFPAKPCTEAIAAVEASIAMEKKNLASFESDKQNLLAQLSCVPGGGGGGGGGGVKPPVCKDGQVVVGKECKSCLKNEIAAGGKCQTCPKGQEVVGNQCKAPAKCTGDKVTDGKGGCVSCPKDQAPNAVKKCVPKPPVCGPAYIPIAAGKCGPDPKVDPRIRLVADCLSKFRSDAKKYDTCVCRGGTLHPDGRCEFKPGAKPGERPLTALDGLAHYLGRSGMPMTMYFDEIDTSSIKPSQFPVIQKAIQGPPRDEKIVISNKKGGNAISFQTIGDHANLLGELDPKLQGTLTLKKRDCSWSFDGRLSDDKDLYDFNKGNRPWGAETKTTIGRLLPGKDFTINIRGSRQIKESGKIAGCK